MAKPDCDGALKVSLAPHRRRLGHSSTQKLRCLEIADARCLLGVGAGKGDSHRLIEATRPVHVLRAAIRLVGREQSKADPELAVLLRQREKVLDGRELIVVDGAGVGEPGCEGVLQSLLDPQLGCGIDKFFELPLRREHSLGLFGGVGVATEVDDGDFGYVRSPWEYGRPRPALGRGKSVSSGRLPERQRR